MTQFIFAALIIIISLLVLSVVIIEEGFFGLCCKRLLKLNGNSRGKLESPAV